MHSGNIFIDWAYSKETFMELDMKEIGDAEVQLWDRSYRRLGEFWEQGPLVLVFLRHFG